MYLLPKLVTFSLSAIILLNSTKAQKLLGSIEFKYSKTKYNGSKGRRDLQNSFSYQFLGGLSKELKDGLRVSAKAGITVDKIYSNFFPRSFKNVSSSNLLAYLGANIQKRLLSDSKKVVALWATTEVAAEPFIRRKSIFVYSFPLDSLNTNISYDGVYIDKKTRFTITPALRVEVKCTKKISLMIQGGYAIELGKSNQSNNYFTTLATLEYFPELVPTEGRIKENYLFAGCGLNYVFK